MKPQIDGLLKLEFSAWVAEQSEAMDHAFEHGDIGQLHKTMANLEGGRSATMKRKPIK